VSVANIAAVLNVGAFQIILPHYTACTTH